MCFVSALIRYLAIGLAVWAAVPLSSCSHTAENSTHVIASSPPIAQADVFQTIHYTYKVVHVYPHDRDAFTEGLAFYNDCLFEGTGLVGSSSIRRVNIDNGEILQEYDLPARFFGEGITVFQDRLIQLTYTSNIGFVYARDSFDLLSEFSYPTEGWGLTHDGNNLIMSDGTSVLRYLDPNTMKIIRLIEIRDLEKSLKKINELEYINGLVYANIWPTDQIAIIDLSAGRVSGWADFSGLLQTQGYSGKQDVLNGIAYDAAADRLFVTGKWWPFLFEVKLVAK